MTWPQNVGNRTSEDLNFKIFWGRMPPGPLLQGTALGGPNIEPPSVKSWIRPSLLAKRLSKASEQTKIFQGVLITKNTFQSVLTQIHLSS